jgi:glycosyltransferase involved in cell wall biosynthesis
VNSLTVLTATYNRGALLARLYQSLCRQTYRSFEWLVIDDGSTDSTCELLKTWARRAPFRIRWETKPNGGKHTALNLGYTQVDTPFVAMIDSDDWYTADGLAVLMQEWDDIPAGDRDSFASVQGRTVSPDGTPTVPPFPCDLFDSDSLTAAAVHGVTGDTKGVHRTEILTAYPFPEHQGFVPEGLVWNRIAARYKTRFINKVVGYNDYQRGGLSDWTPAKVLAAAHGFQQVNQELLSTPVHLPVRHRFKAYVNFVRFSLHVGLSLRDQARLAPSRILWLAAISPGIVLATDDRVSASSGSPVPDIRSPHDGPSRRQ